MPPFLPLARKTSRSFGSLTAHCTPDHCEAQLDLECQRLVTGVSTPRPWYPQPRTLVAQSHRGAVTGFGNRTGYKRKMKMEGPFFSVQKRRPSTETESLFLCFRLSTPLPVLPSRFDLLLNATCSWHALSPSQCQDPIRYPRRFSSPCPWVISCPSAWTHALCIARVGGLEKPVSLFHGPLPQQKSGDPPPQRDYSLHSGMLWVPGS